MRVVNHVFFNFILTSCLLVWLVFIYNNEGRYFTAALALICGVLMPLIPALLVKYPPRFLTVKYFDRTVFLDDVIKVLEKAAFHPGAAFDNYVFFKRHHFFPPREDVVELKFLENNECLIKYTALTRADLKKELSAYVTLREREFLKETDKLMENK